METFDPMDNDFNDNKKSHTPWYFSAWVYLMLAIVSPFMAAAWVQNREPVQLQATSVRSTTPATAAATGVTTPGTDPNTFAKLAEEVVPSVVNIVSRSRPQPVDPNQDLFRRDFERFFGFREMPGGDDEMPDMRRSAGAVALGSGVVIESDNKTSYILTNHHVINGASEIEIQPDKSLGLSGTLKGTVVGADRDLDVALIKVESSKPLPALHLGDSDRIRVGDYVMAVGNPFGQGHSVSHGIISAKERFAPSLLGHYLQTDAPINPGNSGGPLVNLNGEIIGINDAILASAQGIGFAIPSNELRHAVADLKEYGKVRRAFLGVQIGQSAAPQARFASDGIGMLDNGGDGELPRVVGVSPASPAARAGLRSGDVLVQYNGKKIDSVKDFLLSVSQSAIGSEAQLGVLRDGKIVQMNVRLQERPTT